MRLQEIAEFLDLPGQADEADQFRHRNVAFDRQGPGLQPVIDQGIEVAWDVLGAVAQIAPIHADDPGRLRLAGRTSEGLRQRLKATQFAQPIVAALLGGQEDRQHHEEFGKNHTSGQTLQLQRQFILRDVELADIKGHPSSQLRTESRRLDIESLAS